MGYFNFNVDMSTIVLVLNIFVFLLFGFDKLQSKKKGMRIPEAVLVLLSFLLGSFGAILGMVVFNHKTSKIAFRILIPFSIFLNYMMMKDSFYILKQILTYFLQIIPE